jgi:hypothetical protein
MTDSTELTIAGSTGLMPVFSIEQALVRRQAIVDFTREVMREGIDYGKIPGTDKPTLLKPGGEKLTTFFGLRTLPVLVDSEQDWTGERHGGEPFFRYHYRMQLWRGELLIAEADGTCNSWETKYRYRNAERKCPTCGAEAIIKGKAEYGGGWLCWKRRGGCGVKFSDSDTKITDQVMGKVPHPNPAELDNTICKMAQKRALVAATLVAVNASEFFTQDIEDLEYIDAEVVVEEKPKRKAAKSPPRKSKSNGNGRSWSGKFVQGIITNGYAESSYQAVGMLNLSPYDESVPLDTALAWAKAYRAARDAGEKSQDAAKTATLAMETGATVEELNEIPI